MSLDNEIFIEELNLGQWPTCGHHGDPNERRSQCAWRRCSPNVLGCRADRWRWSIPCSYQPARWDLARCRRRGLAPGDSTVSTILQSYLRRGRILRRPFVARRGCGRSSRPRRSDTSRIVGKPLSGVTKLDKGIMAGAIVRGDAVIVPRPHTVIQERRPGHSATPCRMSCGRWRSCSPSVSNSSSAAECRSDDAPPTSSARQRRRHLREPAMSRIAYVNGRYMRRDMRRSGPYRGSGIPVCRRSL